MPVVSIYRGLKHVGQVGVGSRVAILGVGGLGMQGVKIAKLLGAEITCTDLDDRKLERARGFGAAHTINPTREKFLEAANKLGGGFDVVLEHGEDIIDRIVHTNIEGPQEPAGSRLTASMRGV